MSMRAIFKQAAVSLFDAFGDVIEDGTYYSVGDYNPVTETSDETAQITRMAVKQRKGTKQDGQRVSEQMIDIAVIQAELTATPQQDDRIVIDGVSYRVKSIDNKAEVIWIFEAKRA